MEELISRQQAIDAVGWYSCHSGDKLLFADNALRQLPPIQPDNNSEMPNSSDVISRQQAIDAMAELQGSTSSKGILKGISKAWKRIEQLPSVQPERIKGRWEQDGHHIKCDQCGEWMCDRDREGWNIPKNFCPNCGAEMRGEQDG